MALSKFQYNSFDVTPVASSAFAFNSTPNGLTTAASGALNLITTNTITSGVSSSSFTSSINSTYDTYMFKYINIHGSGDDVKFSVNFRDGSTAFDASKTTTYIYAHHKEDTSDPTLGYAGSHDLANGTGYQTLQYQCGTDNDQSTCGTLFLFSPSNTTFVKHFFNASCTYITYDYSHQSYVGGYCNTTSAIDGVDFKFNSGTIDSGVIKMYGLTK